MAAKERRRGPASTPPRGRAAATGRPVAPPGDAGAMAAATVLALTLVAVALLVDPAAEMSFDAPKRLAAAAGAVVAAGLLLGRAGPRGRWPAHREAWPGPARIALGGLGLAALGTVLATAVSPSPAVALAALRGVALVALFVPLGASRALDGGRGPRVLAGALLAGALVAASALLQAAGLPLPVDVVIPAGRGGSGGLAGNEGTLALGLALVVPAAAGAVMTAWRAGPRLGALAAGGLAVGALAAGRNVTGAAATLAGLGALLLARRPRSRHRLAGAAMAVIGLGAVALLAAPPLRARVEEAGAAIRAGDWDRLTSYRLGAWGAAVEMVGARPFTGWGPGSFAAQYVPHRLEAEARWRTRLPNPFLAGSYVEAHSDYLQGAAELGLPAALGAVAALGALLVGLARLAGTAGHPARDEAGLLLGVLVAGAVGALTWFPLQRAFPAVPLLLAAGRGLRLVAVSPDPSAAREPAGDGAAGRRPWTVSARVAAGLALVLALAPELPRYAAEWRLRTGGAALLQVAARQPLTPAAEEALARIEAMAVGAAHSLPGDPRPLALAGAAALTAGHPAQALARYGEALALGERPEPMLNAGRALARLGRGEEALAAFRRAGWVSPLVLGWLPGPVTAMVRADLMATEARFLAGETGTVPPRPVIPRGG